MSDVVQPDEGHADLLELMLLQTAVRYDLRQKAGRQRSCRDLRNLFLRMQKVLRPEIALELGAFRAEFSLAMAREGIPAHAFEANLHNHAACAEAIAATGLPVAYRNEAIGDRDGSVTFSIKRSIAGRPVEPVVGNNSIMRVARDDIDYETVSVPCVTLAGFLAREGLSQRSFSAWIDLEGALGPLLAGAGRAFDTCLSLHVELEDRQFWEGQMTAPEAVAAFLRLGLVPVARDFERPYQYNMIFVNRSLLAQPDLRHLLALHVGQPNREHRNA